ncbi:MAG: LysR family transcriptional regulator [Burkholderiales bacterium]|nr:LysR family transcriptional regulator [Burkholderiales bacterium]
MKLSQLRNLVAVAEAGTIRQAARNLFLSQSSVTKSLQELEAYLGVELLHRTAHGVAPTAAGAALIARAKVVEAELRQARNDIETVRGAGSGEIRVSASPSVAVGLLPRAVLAFKRGHPKVTFQIQEGVYPDVLPAVRMGELDFAICLVPERPRDEELHFELLLRDDLTPAVRTGHPLAGRGRLSFDELVASDLEWVIYRRGPGGRDVYEQTFRAAGLAPPKGTIECTSFACALALVEASDCITLLPSRLFADRQRRMSITPLALASPMPPWNVAVISRAKHRLAPVCTEFLRELHRTAAKMQAPPAKAGAARRTPG